MTPRCPLQAKRAAPEWSASLKDQVCAGMWLARINVWGRFVIRGFPRPIGTYLFGGYLLCVERYERAHARTPETRAADETLTFMCFYRGTPFGCHAYAQHVAFPCLSMQALQVLGPGPRKCYLIGRQTGIMKKPAAPARSTLIPNDQVCARMLLAKVDGLWA